ncbi:MAG TPA: hypothetical protein VKO20_06305 [Desulfosalsimonadaceae bacterium]|nr:hypothetical protein [Desulfosalsimonadaceae bacterium]
MISDAAALGFPVLHGMGGLGFALALLFSFRQKEQPARRAFLAGLFCLCLNLAVLVTAAQRLPLYGMFESLTTILCITGGTLYFAQKKAVSAEFMLGCGVILLLCIFAGIFPLRPNHDFFMYASPWVQGFFFFRLLAAGVILYTGIRFAAVFCMARVSAQYQYNGEMKQISTFLLVGTVLFLCSELAGSIWCLKGWGDSWRWSENFFQSAVVFFLIMINLHIPARMLRSPENRGGFGALTSFAVVFLFLW